MRAAVLISQSFVFSAMMAIYLLTNRLDWNGYFFILPPIV